jgi:hypothetical protein
MHRQDITEEMARTRADFQDLIDNATVADLRNPTQGTKCPMNSCCSTCCSATSSSAT